jgi:hypothetical protein
MPEYTWLDVRLPTGGVDEEPHEAARTRVRVVDDYIHTFTNCLKRIGYGADRLAERTPEEKEMIISHFGEDVSKLAELISSFQEAISTDINYLSGIRFEFDTDEKKMTSSIKKVIYENVKRFLIEDDEFMQKLATLVKEEKE